ncbi:MAG: LysE family translocator [Tannerellaceae bacterium]|jgi:threonine/homoserine/homoserine lactone efflux protein|nr:LysE family translocator [Tannerellaceae bacterium]
MLGLIGKGFLIGVLVSAPLGPVGVLCIQRTLGKGRWSGFFTGVGAMLSDMIYAAVTCLGMGFVDDFIEANKAALQLAGSIVLGIFGCYTYKNNPAKKLKKQRERKISYTSDCITGFLLTFSNVLIVLLYIGLFTRFGFITTDYSVWMLTVGVICIGVGAVVWWLGVTYFISKMGRWFNIRDLWILNKIVGTVILVLAIIGIISVVYYYYFTF